MLLWTIVAAVGLTGCSSAPSASPATTTTAPVGNFQAAIRAGCQHLPQLKRGVTEALGGSDVAARLKSVTSGAAWKAVLNMGQPSGLEGLTGKYRQFIQDVAVLNLGVAAAMSGGPTTSLKQALSNLSSDCQKAAIPCANGCSYYNQGTAHHGIGKGGESP